MTALALAALLLVPSALGGWSVKGAHEPDTPFDLEPGVLALSPDVDPATGILSVYFNGFGAVGGAASTTLNPNVATLGTSIAPTPFVPVAVLGIWKDCNADGFMGLGDNGAFEYSTALLSRGDICPTTPQDPERPWLLHNDGTWVIEFIPIGYDDITSPEDENAINLNDTEARVWADWGLPGDAASLSCSTVPAPYGTFRSTGGLLRWADCSTGFRGIRAANDAFSAAGEPGLGFGDAPADRPDQSASPLNAPNPWGNEEDEAAVRVFDCDTQTEVPVGDPTGGALDVVTDDDGRITTVTLHSPAGDVHPSGSLAGTVNETQAGLSDCDRGDAGETLDLDGEQAGSDAEAPYALEGGAEPTTPYAQRTRTDHAFTFEEGVRGADPLAAVLGERTREHAGLGLASVTGFWVGDAGASSGHSFFVSRGDLGAERVTYITYYAHISEVLIRGLGLRLPSGPFATPYGLHACNRGTADCDDRRWWRDTDGKDITPRDSRLGADPDDPTVPLDHPSTRIGVRIGQPYNMRDIDCIDMSFEAARSRGVQWGAATNSTCLRP